MERTAKQWHEFHYRVIPIPASALRTGLVFYLPPAHDERWRAFNVYEPALDNFVLAASLRHSMSVGLVHLPPDIIVVVMLRIIPDLRRR